MSTQEKARGSNSPSFARILWLDYGMILIAILIFLFCCFMVPRFFTIFNLRSLALAVSMTGMVACTMMLVLASGNFDMSCGAVIACSGVVAAVVIRAVSAGYENVEDAAVLSMVAGIGAALLVGLIIGLINGMTIAYARINALITTLATMQITRGFGYIFGEGKAVGIVQEDFFKLGNNMWLGIPVPVYITVACFIAFGIILEKTAFGRNTLAIGGNEEAANLAGIRVAKHKLKLFVIHGLMAAFAGIVMASRMTSGQPTVSQGFELDVISACVLGGISMAGGIASIWYVVAGVLIMGMMQNSMNLVGVQTFYQYVARGAILLVAVIFDRYKQRR